MARMHVLRMYVYVSVCRKRPLQKIGCGVRAAVERSVKSVASGGTRTCDLPNENSEARANGSGRLKKTIAVGVALGVCMFIWIGSVYLYRRVIDGYDGL